MASIIGTNDDTVRKVIEKHLHIDVIMNEMHPNQVKLKPGDKIRLNKKRKYSEMCTFKYNDK